MSEKQIVSTFGEVKDRGYFWVEDPDDGLSKWSKQKMGFGPYIDCECDGVPNARQHVRNGRYSPAFSHFCPSEQVIIVRQVTVTDALKCATAFWENGTIFTSAYVRKGGAGELGCRSLYGKHFVPFQPDDLVWIGDWKLAEAGSKKESSI